MIFTAVLYLYLVLCSVGSSNDDDGGEEKSSSFRRILFNANVVITSLLTGFIGCVWTTIGPILEPELRNKVCVLYSVRNLVIITFSTMLV